VLSTREWPDIGPNDLLVVCSRCIDSSGRRQGVFVVDEGPDGVIVGRVLRRCPHSDSPPNFSAVTARYLASWRPLLDDPTQVLVQEISVGTASWTLGRRADVLRIDPRL
jgi:hypothetical protein